MRFVQVLSGTFSSQTLATMTRPSNLITKRHAEVPPVRRGQRPALWDGKAADRVAIDEKSPTAMSGLFDLAPPVGFEPTTNGLTVRCATAAPQGNNSDREVYGSR